MAKLTYNPRTDSPLDIKVDKRNEVFNFGSDNAYPTLIESLIEGSVTAKTCVERAAKSIYGKSLGDAGKAVVNKDGQSLNEVLRIAAREYAKHGNLFLHIGYNGELAVNSIKVVPSTWCRKGQDDDEGYSGKIVVYNNWAKDVMQKIMPSKFKIIDTYNPNKSVISAQIEAAGGLPKYKGQILHMQKNSNSIYSLSDLHTVREDALLESKAQTFRRRGSDKGFLNTKLMVVKPFADEEEERDFQQSLINLQGSDNSGGVLVLEVDVLGEQGVDANVKLEDLSSPYNDTMFQYSEESARKNICIAFGVPLNLVDNSDSGLFGNSGELLRAMKEILWESREEERDMFEETFNRLGKQFHTELPVVTIQSPIINPTNNTKLQDNGTD